MRRNAESKEQAESCHATGISQPKTSNKDTLVLDKEARQQTGPMETVNTITSEYAEQDIFEGLEEIFPDKSVVKSSTLVSRVQQATCSAVHYCVLELQKHLFGLNLKELKWMYSRI